MRLELDTNSLSTDDLAMLRILDREQRERERAASAHIKQLEDENADLREQIAELRITTPTKDVGSRVRALFDDDKSIYTVQKVGHDHYGSVYAAPHLLREEGILASSSTRPIKFFLKESGNPELRAAIPTGTKVSVMK